LQKIEARGPKLEVGDTQMSFVAMSAMFPIQTVRYPLGLYPEEGTPPAPLCRFVFLSLFEIIGLNPKVLREKFPDVTAFSVTLPPFSLFALFFLGQTERVSYRDRSDRLFNRMVRNPGQ
jgi:hypothetical protein